MMTTGDPLNTVEPPFKGHAWDQEKCPLNRGQVRVVDN